MKKAVAKLIGLGVLLASFALGWLLLDFRSFVETPLQVPAGGEVVVVSSGTSLNQLARQLQRRGIVRHARYLAWLGRLKSYAHNIQAGEYQLEPGIKPEGLLVMLVEGKVKQYALTIVEGSTFAEVMASVRRDKALRQTLEGLNAKQVMAKLGGPGSTPEGWLYPDTYRFPRGTTDLEFLTRAYHAMREHLQREWQERQADLPLKTPYDALILASIVEKETALAEERGKIAGVFVRRLEKGMRLQTDPTVIYGLGTAYDGNIHTRDLRRDTPYNTYTRNGLPPTPICMPSAQSIRAVLHPEPGRALYFVSKGDGSHYFSDTFEQHNRAVLKFQLKR